MSPLSMIVLCSLSVLAGIILVVCGVSPASHKKTRPDSRILAGSDVPPMPTEDVLTLQFADERESSGNPDAKNSNRAAADSACLGSLKSRIHLKIPGVLKGFFREPSRTRERMQDSASLVGYEEPITSEILIGPHPDRESQKS